MVISVSYTHLDVYKRQPLNKPLVWQKEHWDDIDPTVFIDDDGQAYMLSLIHIYNYSPTLFTDNEVETSFRSEVGDCVDYYFMYGKDADGVIAQVRSLTGQAPMFPLWTGRG